MLKRIGLLSEPEIAIDFTANAINKVFRVDSVNLIIGDNGSGKTRLIKRVISSLSELDASDALVEMDNKKLGVVYYTSAPFHLPIKLKPNAHLKFIDASPLPKEKHSFYNTAREYVHVSRQLQMNVPTKVSEAFDFTILASKLVSSFYRIKGKASLPGAYLELYEQFMALTRDITSAKSDSESERAPANDSLENIVKQRAAIRNKLMELIFKIRGPRNQTTAIEWVAAMLFIDGADGRAPRPDFGPFFLVDDYTRLPIKLRGWHKHLEAVQTFILKAKRRGIAKFEWTRQGATFDCDLPNLVSSSLPLGLIDEANARGLIGVGFGKLSSGEAAITHQLASIASTVQKLDAEGYKHILIFVDEGDLLLHLNWQRNYLDLLDERLHELKKTLTLASLQVVVASHSPLLATDVPRNAITKLSKKAALAGFGAPLQKIFNYSFDVESIGLIAERKINELFNASRLTDEDKAFVDLIDDDYVRESLQAKAAQS
jgi:hypothetical protein